MLSQKCTIPFLEVSLSLLLLFMMSLLAQKSLKDDERESEHVSSWFKTFRRQSRRTKVFECTSIGIVVHGWLGFSRTGLGTCRCHTVERPAVALSFVSVLFRFIYLFVYYRQDLPEGQLCPYCFYSRANFRVFRPAGAKRCTDKGEIWHGGADRRSASPCQISP